MYEIYCKLRDERGMRDADVARETGITKSTFTDWKNGRSEPKDAKLRWVDEEDDFELDEPDPGYEYGKTKAEKRRSQRKKADA